MDRKRLLRNPLIWILAAILVYFTFSVLFDDTRGFKQEPTSVALAQIEGGNVREALIEDKEQRLRLTLNQPVDGSTQIITQYPTPARRSSRRCSRRRTSPSSTPPCARSRSWSRC